MASLVEVLSVDERGQGEGDAVTDLLLVAQANLRRVVHLGSESSILVQGVLAANGKAGGVGASGP